MLKVPFVTKIKPKDRDPKLLDKLVAEADGILQWAIKGWIEYRSKGLSVPNAIRKASRQYRASQGLVSEFIGEMCVTGDGKTVKPKTLHKTFRFWCKKYRINRPIRPRRFDQEMRSRGFSEDYDSDNSRVWLGVELTEEAKDEINAPF